MGLALLAGFVYLIIRRRSKISDDRDGTSAYLDNKPELDVNPIYNHDTSKAGRVKTMSELKEGSRIPELSGQSLAELPHSHEHPAVEMD